MSRQVFLLAAALLIGVAASLQSVALSQDGQKSAQPQGFPQLPAGTPRGYLDPTALPDSLALLPSPPAPGSPGFARDEAAREAVAKLRDRARWSRATSDADLHFPHAAETFSCAANVPISQERMPRLYTLLAKAFVDVGLSTYRAKLHYQRVRPFVMHNGSSCTPAEENFLRMDGSYPSGHSAAGWGWALLLTEIVPGRADEILARGRDFGESRVVCNVHWQSDVDAGRVIAAAAVARRRTVDVRFGPQIQTFGSRVATSVFRSHLDDGAFRPADERICHQRPQRTAHPVGPTPRVRTESTSEITGG
jgi:acid phosphatase (class A)